MLRRRLGSERPALTAAAAVAAAFVLAACGMPAPLCAPNATQPCTCGAAAGTQVCSADGLHYGACSCADGGTADVHAPLPDVPSPLPDVPSPLPDVPTSSPCSAAASCDACTPVNGCGWCNGRCVPGSPSGPSSGGACTGGWAWLPSDCTAPPPPPPDVTCTRNCTGRVCGPDGCGGTCGSCPAGTACNAAGACASTCTRNCTGRVCGTDGCGGTCGTCPSGTACNASGACVSTCAPMCAGRACGPDGCGGSCGACPGGFACTAAGTCAECTEGATQCIAGDIASVRRCVGGRWTTSACGSFQLCTSNACRAICEEVVPVATGSVVCAVPNADGVNNGVWWVTNDTTRLPLARLAAGVFNYGGTTPSPIIAVSGRTWPWAWQSNGPGTIVFPLSGFARPVSRVAMRVASRRAYVTASITRHYFGFNNGSGVFAAVPNPPADITSSSWTPYYAYITSSGSPSTGSFNYLSTGGDSVSYAFTGDGFGGVWDSMQLNWMFLQIDP